jgi:cobalt-zinc-cadmium resistance protein CzcA
VLDAVTRFALARRGLVILGALALVAAGGWAFRQLKLEAYPDISDTGVVVITVYPGFAAEEVEQRVTIPIERALHNTPRVIDRRSRTIFGLSVVELTFAQGTDDYFARQLVLERLRDAELPEGVTPGLGPLSSGISEFYRYVLDGPGHDTMQLREIQDWVVVPALTQVDGVAEVVTFGGIVRQYHVEVDPAALDRHRLSIRHVVEAIERNNQNAGGALLTLGSQSLAIRGSGLIESIEDIGNIVLDARNGVPIFVHDIGQVRIGALPPTGVFGLNRERGGVGRVEGIVLMRRWENPSEVLGRIHEAVDEINARKLPRGVRLVAIHDRTELVHNTLRTIGRVLVEGFTVVVVVLFAFLVSVRAALLTALVVPLSLLFSFVCMQLTGVSLSLLSVGALDFGIIVDATVVMVERIMRSLAEPAARHPASTLERIRAAVGQVQRPILFSMVILITGYLPLLALERVERRLFMPMALTIVYALVGSLVLTLTLVPAAASYLFTPGTRSRRHRVLEALTAAYGRVVAATIRFAGVTVAVAGLVVVGTVALGARLGVEFLPPLDEGVIWIRASLTAGVSLEASAEVAARFRELIAESPEVKMVMSQTGRNEDGTDPFGPNRNELLVELHPYDTWRAGRTKAGLVTELAQRLRAEFPAVAFNFTQPIIDTSTEIATGSSADLAVIISGPDRAQLRALARQTLEALRGIRGATDASIEQEADQAQLQIRVNRHQVARYGLNVADVHDVIDFALGGRPVTTVYEGERRFDVVARFVPEARADPGRIGALLIPAPDGARVPLAQLADIRTVDGATIIARRDNRRAMTVRTNIRGRDQGGFVRDAQARVAQAVSLPAGYEITWGGQFENLARARDRLTLIIPLTVALIFVLLVVTFSSPLDAAIVLLTVPFSLAGGVAALALRGIHLSVSAAVGFVSLFGVAVMAGVLYISEVNRRRGPETDLREALVGAARHQFRPLLTLIVAAMLGLLPAALASGIGSDIQRPLATVVVGGLLATLVLTLVALPAVYRLTEPLRRRRGPGPATGPGR